MNYFNFELEPHWVLAFFFIVETIIFALVFSALGQDVHILKLRVDALQKILLKKTGEDSNSNSDTDSDDDDTRPKPAKKQSPTPTRPEAGGSRDAGGRGGTGESGMVIPGFCGPSGS